MKTATNTFALYEEYIGSQRQASDVRMLAVAPTVELLQPVYEERKRQAPMMRFRLEDWDTGETLQTL